MVPDTYKVKLGVLKKIIHRLGGKNTLVEFSLMAFGVVFALSGLVHFLVQG